MLISPAYQALNQQHHEEEEDWGQGAWLYIDIVRDLVRYLNSRDVLDYGCGKGSLQKQLGFAIQEYDPAIPAKSAKPKPADIVVCTSVLEHVEPDCVNDVLADIRRLIKRVGFFVIPHTPSVNNLPNGQNEHLSVHPQEWWQDKLKESSLHIHSLVTIGAITVGKDNNATDPTKPNRMMIGTRSYMFVVPC